MRRRFARRAHARNDPDSEKLGMSRAVGARQQKCPHIVSRRRPNEMNEKRLTRFFQYE